ncbi:MAG: DHA2 family efflux MFS transporter permease subunit, partial [Planctomycetaceae bacterium]|nr:DHA2 family efflux MFS transporter permease subunit [Planctomycetaceae bacterium]
VAALLLLGGALGDHFGRRRIFMAGITIFAVASLACGLAAGTRSLIAARAIQGLGAALMIPGSLSLISATFEPSRRGRAIGVWSACSVVMTALGPILGGLLAQAGLWRGVFFVNLPLALLSLVILKVKVPEDIDETTSRPLDYGGALLSVVGLASFNYGLIEAASRGWHDPFVVTGTVTGIICLAAFARVERRAAAPLLPLDLFHDHTLVAACFQTLCFYSGLFGMMFFLSLNLIQVQQYDPAFAGLAQLPLMLLVVLLSPMAGRLVDRYGPRLPLVIGGTLASLGFLVLAQTGLTAGPREYWSSFLPALTLLGLAMGISAAPLSTTVMNSVQHEQTGVGSGINSTLSRLSAVLGVAVLGLVALLSFEHSLMSQVSELHLSSEETAILANESIKLAEAQPPPGMPVEAAAAVKLEIKRAYITAFRNVSYVCAGTVGFSTLITAALIPRRTVS